MVTAAKTTKAPKKAAAKHRSAATSQPKTVDYYPNRMTFAVAALAVVFLFLLATIITVNL